jgi:hypothetical protein
MRLVSHSLATRVHTPNMIFKVIFALGILNQRWLSCKSAQGTDDNATESLQAAPLGFDTLLRSGHWHRILLDQTTSIDFLGWAGHRLPLKHHGRRCGRFHHSESIFDGTSAKKSI